MEKTLNGVVLTTVQAEAVAMADAHLNNVGFTTYTQLAEQMHRANENTLSITKLEEDNQALLLQLLKRARLYLDGGHPEAARDIIQGLIDNRS